MSSNYNHKQIYCLLPNKLISNPIKESEKTLEMIETFLNVLRITTIKECPCPPVLRTNYIQTQN